MTALPLSGVRVLDLTRVLAGPFCTMTLADLGADVIKIEQPGVGDETRHWGPPWAGDDDPQAAYYLSVNRNKRSVALDLKTPEGQQAVRRLAAQSHVFVENFKPGGLARLGLGYDDLHALNPALVYASITGFGQTGPYRERPGYDYVIQAMSGLMSITGEPDGSPQKVGVAVADVFTGLFAANSILAALRHAERTGQGQHLDVALLDVQLAALVNVAANALVGGGVPPRQGAAHPNIVPYQTFAASDGPFVLACGNDRQFAALCALLNQPDWAQDARFATNPARVQHRDVLVPLLAERFATQPAAHWVDALLAAGIPAGPLNTVTEALHDAHIAARGLLHPVVLPNGTHTTLVGPPVQFSGTPPQVYAPPPTLGQHTEEVLGTLPSA